jgi:sulfur-oxidizing protein SoxX
MAVALTVAAGQDIAQERRVVANSHLTEGTSLEPLTDQPGDAARGRRIILDREGGDCTICHAMPLPQRQFHGTIGPALDGVADRYSAGELRLRLVDPKRLNPDTIMPAYHSVEGLQDVQQRYRGKPILTAQQIEDVVAYLLTVHSP